MATKARLRYSIFLLSLLIGFSCKKASVSQEEEHPVMVYKDLRHQIVELSQPEITIDVDGNGTVDLIFSVSVAFDPVTQVTQKRAQVICVAGTFIPIKLQTICPVLNYGDRIEGDLFPEYSWNNAWLSILSSKTLSPVEGSWQGNWTDVSHKYVPFLIDRPGHVYYGWIELSFNSLTEQITLHKCAVVSESGKDKSIRAGF